MAIEIGQEAPGFTLFDSERNKVSLVDFKGKNVVLLFFPLAFSSVCTAELCSVRDNMGLYNEAHAQVLGISVDSLFVLNKFRQDQHLNFPLLSDFNKEAAKAYDVLYELFPAFDMQGVGKRAAFVINMEGIVKYAEVCPTPGHQPNFTAMMEILGDLK